MSIKTVEYYMNLPYTLAIVPDYSDSQQPVWFARVEELPGCITEADSFEEAGVMLRDAMAGWFEVALQYGIPIHEPKHENVF